MLRRLGTILVVAGSLFLMAAEWDSCVTVDGRSQFTDVDKSHPHYTGIRIAEAQGDFRGFPDGSLRPNELISVEQIATVVSRKFPEGATRGEVASFIAGGTYALWQNVMEISIENSGSNSAVVTVENGASFEVDASQWVLKIDNGEYGDDKQEHIVMGNRLGVIRAGASKEYGVGFAVDDAVLYDRQADLFSTSYNSGIRIASQIGALD